MKKKLISLLFFFFVAVPFMAGCSDTGSENDDIKNSSSPVSSAGQSDSSAESGTSAKKAEGLSLKVNNSDGKMNISRAEKKNTPMGEKDTWTVFVYLCGTDLESQSSAATNDILQMVNAEISDNVKIIFQTGGTSEWTEGVFSADEMQRYIIKNKDAELIESLPLADMGSPDTLKDFLKWGVSNYPAEKMGVIFWDHGGGSISGVCADELYEKDCITLPEMNQALSEVYSSMTDQSVLILIPDFIMQDHA